MLLTLAILFLSSLVRASHLSFSHISPILFSPHYLCRCLPSEFFSLLLTLAFLCFSLLTFAPQLSPSHISLLWIFFLFSAYFGVSPLSCFLPSIDNNHPFLSVSSSHLLLLTFFLSCPCPFIRPVRQAPEERGIGNRSCHGRLHPSFLTVFPFCIISLVRLFPSSTLAFYSHLLTASPVVSL